jgi:carbon storage regulator CsrA
MLVLTRKRFQRIRVGTAENPVWITLIDVGKEKVRLGVEAAKDTPIVREELLPPVEQYRPAGLPPWTAFYPAPAPEAP